MLHLPMIFSDHMVLQRQKPIAVWGETAANTSISVSLWDGCTMLASAGTTSDEHGKWRLHLPEMDVGRGLSLKIDSEGETILFRDVLIGEVWIAGGQSNMEYFMFFDAEKTRELERPENPDVRFFDYPEVSYEEALSDYDFSEFGFWRRCRREELPWFSAVGYYFADKLHTALDVPIGIVGCNWGGTRACCWMSEEYVQDASGAVWLEDYERGIEGIDLTDYCQTYRGTPDNIQNHPIPGPFPKITYPGLTREEQFAAMPQMEKAHLQKYASIIGPYHPGRPCGLYQTMLSHIVPYTVKGVLWYQGESDEAHPEIYGQILTNLIRNWRELWGEELPFLIVQLAPFEAWFGESGVNYPILRNLQEKVSSTVPGVYLCSNSDAGMRWDIHPKHKRLVGERLALLARGHIYGDALLCDAPAFSSIWLSGDTAVLKFDHADGLHLRGSKTINALTVNGHPGTGKIENGHLVISLPPAERWMIEFANTPYYEVNLYNDADIPAIPFTVEIGKKNTNSSSS